MFDLSLAEMALVLLVAFIFIGPKELPALIRQLSRCAKAVRGLLADFRSTFNQLAEESGLKDEARAVQAEMRMIQGDDGEWYEAYTLPPSEPSPSDKEKQGE